MKNYYDILGLEYDADTSSIKTAYRKLSKKFHPDLNPNDKFFEKMFKDINEANEVLSDSSSKEKYDNILGLYQNRHKNVGRTLEDIERRIKKEFEEILNQKAEEIKKKFWTYEQHRKEEERIQRQKDKEEKERKLNQLKTELAKLQEEKSKIDTINNDYQTKIEKGNERKRVISKRMSEIDKLLNPDRLTFNSNSKNVENRQYNFNINKESSIKKSLDLIRKKIDLQKREVFLRSLLNFCKSKSMSAKFTSENSELKDLILNSYFNNAEFTRIYNVLGSQTIKIENFEKEMFNYIN